MGKNEVSCEWAVGGWKNWGLVWVVASCCKDTYMM